METGNSRTSKTVRLTVVLAVIAACVAFDACVVVYALQTFFGVPVLPLPEIKIIGHNCGHVYQSAYIGASGDVYDPDRGELCLWRAYTKCHTSTLIVDSAGLENSSTDAITVQSTSGHCVVTDTERNYSEGVFGTRTIGAIFQCAGLVQERTGGLLVRDCGSSGDLSLLPRPSEQVGHVCGIILSNNHTVSTVTADGQRSVTDIEACFWQAYRSCTLPATLVYDQVIVSDTTDIVGIPDNSLTEHTLVVQPLHGTCALTDAVSIAPPPSPSIVNYSCASLSRDTDGSLIAQDCGAERQVIVSSVNTASVK